MALISGGELFGTVDRVPGVCRVCTRFWHLFFFPFRPIQAFLVVEGGPGNRAYPISTSTKSAGFAVVRAILLDGFLLTASSPLDGLLRERPAGRRLSDMEKGGGVAGLGFLALFAVSYPVSRPAPGRRRHLLQLVEAARRRDPAPAGEEGTDDRTPGLPDLAVVHFGGCGCRVRRLPVRVPRRPPGAAGPLIDREASAEAGAVRPGPPRRCSARRGDLREGAENADPTGWVRVEFRLVRNRGSSRVCGPNPTPSDRWSRPPPLPVSGEVGPSLPRSGRTPGQLPNSKVECP